MGLGDLPGRPVHSHALGVSADGRVVTGQSASAAGLVAFRREKGVMLPLGPMPSGSEAFRCQDGALSGLGDLPGGAFFSIARSVSADGTVVVGNAIAGVLAYHPRG